MQKELSRCENCLYSEIADWVDDTETKKSIPILWCEKHRVMCEKVETECEQFDSE